MGVVWLLMSNGELLQIQEQAELVPLVPLTHHKGGKGKMLYMAGLRQQITLRCSLGYQEAVTFHRDKQTTYFKQVGKFLGESR